MIGSIGEILMAISLMIFIAGLLRWTFGRGPQGALPDENGDLGLLETVAVVPTREAADVLVCKLAREKRTRRERRPPGAARPVSELRGYGHEFRSRRNQRTGGATTRWMPPPRAARFSTNSG